MADCTGNITDDILLDCVNLPIAGLEVNMIIVNRKDVDLTATTFDVNNRLLCTNFQLKSEKTGFLVEGIKQSNSKNYALVLKENLPDKFSHAISGTVFNPSVENKLQVAQLALGATYVAIVQQKWKGADNKDAFEILGFNVGLKLTEATNNSGENDNTIVLTLASEDGFEEPTLPLNLLMTDYATTEVVFGNKFIQA